ncbi:Flavin-containing monooxygenase YUCCA3 [Termitomyces sp. J132]|nr:Flavin-containing monooxygenase YUCCA3 [Termitomyces sp. J132]
MTTENLVPEPPLPTLQRLDTTIPADLDAKAIGKAWFTTLALSVEVGDVQGVTKLFVDDGFWRDILAFTWDFRTFSGLTKITQFLVDCSKSPRPTAFASRDDAYLGLQRSYPDIAWINLFFQTIRWKNNRKREIEFVDKSLMVLIVGGGQSGLDVAARLKALDVPTLIIEKNQRIGDNWRNRYHALCLHDPVWYDHVPYLPFPPTWRVYTPAAKLANRLESYAEALELNVRTSSLVVNAMQDGDLGNGLVSKKVLFPRTPAWILSKGQILHSNQHKDAADYIGKRVFVVGASTSAHDICVDRHENGVDVTIHQRSSTYVMSTTDGWKVVAQGNHSSSYFTVRTYSLVYFEGGRPTDIADRLSASFPNHVTVGLAQRQTKDIVELDKFVCMLKFHHGNIDYASASQLIVDGKTKLKSGSQLERLTETGVKFEDGPERKRKLGVNELRFEPARLMIE